MLESYSVKQIAEMLDTNPETVRRWIRDKKLDSVQVSRKDGNVVTEAELLRFLKASPKYLPKYRASVFAAGPVAGASIVLAGLLGSKLLAYLDDKKNYDVRVRTEDIEKYIKDSIAAHSDAVNKKEAAIKQLQAEIETEEQQIEQLKYALIHKELFTETDNKSSSD